MGRTATLLLDYFAPLFILVPGIAFAELSPDVRTCTGVDCLSANSWNLSLVERGREGLPLDKMCALGDLRSDSATIFQKVSEFCENSLIEDERSSVMLSVDHILARAMSDRNDSYQRMTRDFVKNDRYFPNAIYLHLNSDPCGWFKRGNCFIRKRNDFLNSQDAIANLTSNLMSKYRNLPEPKLTACVNEMQENVSLFGNFEFNRSIATEFCQSVSQLLAVEATYDQFEERTREPLQSHLEDVVSGYKQWFRQIPGLDVEKFEDRLSYFGARLLPKYELQDIENTSFQAGVNLGTKTISYNPFYGGFLEAPGQSQNLWAISAHELAHPLTIDFRGNIDWDFLSMPVGADVVRSCIQRTFRLHRSYTSQFNTTVEPLADYLMIGALPYALSQESTQEDWQLFIRRTTNPFCAMFYSFSLLDQRRAISGNVSPKGHPLLWIRINAIFSNNLLREKLGCERITREDHQCHDWL